MSRDADENLPMKHGITGSEVEIDENKLQQLLSMGFNETQSRQALAGCHRSLHSVVDSLLSGEAAVGRVENNDVSPTISSVVPSPSETTRGADDLIKCFDCSISQYTVENGRSACTCIALTAATLFLQDPAMSTEFLEHMIHRGVSNYLKLVSSTNTGVEHLSVEEVLQQHHMQQVGQWKQQHTSSEKCPELVCFPLEILPGGVRQGMLSNDRSHPMGLKAVLEGLRVDHQQLRPHEWMAVIVTKTPETVLLCFPPTNNESGFSHSPFYLIDSHPRPALGTFSAYSVACSQVGTLLHTLDSIFNYIDLGPDIPEMMATMYNSFDVYPLLLMKS